MHCMRWRVSAQRASTRCEPQIAAQLDASEQALWAENGLDSEEYLRYIAEGSSNVADNGMFSVQARTQAKPSPWPGS